MDLALDIVGDLEMNWRWKDQEEWDVLVSRGLFTRGGCSRR
jgi:hypothetical protein